MKALFYTGTEQSDYRDAAEPQVAPGQALLDVQASSICGSDMHAWHGHDERRVPPMVLGHEICAIPQEGRHAGRPVAINPLIDCGECADCRAGRTNLCRFRSMIGMQLPGGFSDRLAVSERHLLPLPAGMNPVHAALTEPTGTAVHAVALAERVMQRPISDARTLVIGGGAIGLLVALILRAKGARTVDLAETNPLRRATAEAQNCATVFDPLSTKAPSAGEYEAVFDCVGSGATRAAASAAVGPGGLLSMVGLQDRESGLDARRLTLAEVLVQGCYCYTHGDLLSAIDLLHSGRLGNMAWVEERPLSEGARAFEDLHKGAVAAAKIVLRP